MESQFQSGLPPEEELKLQEEADEWAASHFPGKASRPPHHLLSGLLSRSNSLQYLKILADSWFAI